MNISSGRKITTLLFNPFVYIAGGQALGLGLAAIILAALLGFAGGTHFDGVLDTHSGSGGPIWLFIAVGVIDWLCLAVVLLVLGKLVSSTAFRFIDVFGTQALARWPTIFIALLTLAPGYQRFVNHVAHLLMNPERTLKQPLDFFTADTPVFLTVAFLMLPLVVWFVALTYNAYSVSCNVRGAKAAGTFIASLILAEILSKIAISALVHAL